jgi:hypothetical protein
MIILKNKIHEKLKKLLTHFLTIKLCTIDSYVHPLSQNNRKIHVNVAKQTFAGLLLFTGFTVDRGGIKIFKALARLASNSKFLLAKSEKNLPKSCLC